MLKPETVLINDFKDAIGFLHSCPTPPVSDDVKRIIIDTACKDIIALYESSGDCADEFTENHPDLADIFNVMQNAEPEKGYKRYDVDKFIERAGQVLGLDNKPCL